MPTGTTGTYGVTSRTTNAVTASTGAATSRDAAVAAVVAAVVAGGPTGIEAHVYTSDLILPTGATGGVYRTTFNTTLPLTGATYAAFYPAHAHNQAIAAAPTGPGAGISIFQTTPPSNFPYVS